MHTFEAATIVCVCESVYVYTYIYDIIINFYFNFLDCIPLAEPFSNAINSFQEAVPSSASKGKVSVVNWKYPQVSITRKFGLVSLFMAYQPLWVI